MPQTTLVFFADQPMRDDQWTSLFDAMHRGQSDLAPTTPALSGDVNLLRGDKVEPGLRVATGIVVYIHGDCRLIPRPRLVVMGPLGWVPRVHGRIQPFVNVDCGRIVEMLGPLALGMSTNRRNTVMAEAMSRVILHEWIHFSTQNAKHSDDGVSKSLFTVPDLLADDVSPNMKRRSFRAKTKAPIL